MSQRLHLILLCIHQYRIRILYDPGPQLYIADLLFRHYHTRGKDEEITCLNLNINTVTTTTDIPECMIAEEIRHASQGRYNAG